MTEPKVIDAEQHVFVESLDDLLPYLSRAWQQKLTVSEFVLPPSGPHPGVEIERRALAGGYDPVATAAALGSDLRAALLVAPQALVTSGWLGHEMAEVFNRAMNDYVIDRWLTADDRFRLAVAVSAHDIAAAAREVHRVASHPQVAAVTTSLLAINMGHRHYYPLYEACQEFELPLVVHPGGFEGSVIGPAALGGIGPRTPEETFSVLPQVAMSNVASLVFDGVFERFPRLSVVFAGFGVGWVPPVLWRADAEWRGLRVEVPWLTEPPSEVAARHIRFVVDGACEMDSVGAWELAQMLPDGMLLYGSDAPFVPDPRASLANAPAHLRAPIQYENALATFPRLRSVVPV